MILNVELKNWRAYDHAFVDLQAPVVFFVAPNGVGKSSLVEAIRWCVLGRPVAKNARAAVRKGAAEALVTVELRLDPDGPVARISRTLTPTGRTKLLAMLGHEEMLEGRYEELLVKHWSASPSLIDSLTFTDPAVPASKSAFPVRDHLAAALGVTPMLDVARELEGPRKAAEDQVLAIRSEIKDANVRLDTVEELTDTSEAQLQALMVERTSLAATVAGQQKLVVIADQWFNYRTQLADYQERANLIVDEIAAFVAVPSGDPAADLASAQTKVQTSLKEARDSATNLQIDDARSERASEMLRDPTDRCPTCLRPITDHERSVAIEEHGTTRARATHETTQLDSTIDSETRRLTALTELAAALAALRQPDAPEPEDPGPLAKDELTILREREVTLAGEIGGLEAEAAALADRSRTVDEIAAHNADLNRAAEEEQLLASTIEVLDNVADQTLTDRIDPLLVELSHRWKTLFGADGLTLRTTGDLVVTSPDGELRINDLSGGERATALLITRLLVTAITTDIPTVCFDEPLEHLDPRRRSAVAKTLVRAAQTGTVSQIIITTYEDRIARQLAAADPSSVRIVHADKPLTR